MKNIHLMNMDFEKNFLNGNGNHGGRPLTSYINPINYEFEYLAFLCLGNNQDDLLCSQFPAQYSGDYLESVELFSPFPDVTSFKEVKDLEACNLWWGCEDNFSLAKELNSKFTSAIFMQKYSLYEKLFCIIKSESDLIERLNKEQHLNGNNFIYKNMLSMSGMGHKFFRFKDQLAQNASTLKELIKGVRYPGIFMPLFDRTFDLGIRINDSGIFRVIFNKVDERGQFKGAFTFLDETQMKDFLQKNYHVDLDFYSSFYNDLWKEYKNHGATDSIQVDCFGIKQSTFNFLPMVEINYRRTMGDILVSLMEKVKRNGYKFSCAELLITNNGRPNDKRSPNIFRLTPKIVSVKKADLNSRVLPENLSQLKVPPRKFEVMLILANNLDELSKIKLENNLAD